MGHEKGKELEEATKAEEGWRGMKMGAGKPQTHFVQKCYPRLSNTLYTNLNYKRKYFLRRNNYPYCYW